MIQNNLKLALRNFSRNRLYVLLNVLGMGVGIALLIWGVQTYRFSASFDDFQPNRAQIFRAVISREGNDEWKGICPLPMAQMAQRDFASIADVVRWDSRGCDIKGQEREPFSEQVHFTDPSFFKMFEFPLVKGSHDLSDKSAVLLSEKMAQKYFGQDDPIGKTLLLYAGEKRTLPLTVQGVLKDTPKNSSFQFDILTNLENMKTSDTTFLQPNDWKWFLDAVFFKIPNPSDAEHLAKSFNQYIPLQNAARLDWKITGFRLMPLTTMARESSMMSANGLVQSPEDSATYGPLVVALLIFLSACLNFANTTVSRSNRRLREMGVRKTMGGTRSQLMGQILMECGVVVLGAIALSMLINKWWLPTFNSMFDGITVSADYLHDSGLQWFMAGILVFTTLLAGAYPAFYISSFNASQVFRGGAKFGGNNLFSRFLLGFQVMISLITVIAGLGFARNAQFQRDYDYGYDRAGLMGVSVPDRNTYESLRNAVQEIPGVESVAGTRHHIGFGYRSATAEAEGQKREVGYFETGENYLEIMDLHLVEGRAFDPTRESDYTNALLISQKMAAEFGWTGAEALGKQVRMDTATYTVIGTIQDFHQQHLFDPIQPAAMRLAHSDRYFNLIVRAKPAELKSVHDRVKAQWSQLSPLKPFHGFYQDEVGAQAYKVTSSIATVFSWFAVVAMLLTATGLFALVSLTVLKKMKEIALRKVVGARPWQIMALVNRGYVWVFAIGAGFGCYAGWFMTKLLMDMIFKVNIGVEPLTLLLGVSALFLISGLTVGFKVRQAVRTNPADVLRSE
jgi:putative ABC transport system permease protein